MYKSTSRNLLGRAFRAAQRAKPTRFKLKNLRKKKRPNDTARRKAAKEWQAQRTEPKLIKALGAGPNFVRTVYYRYAREFESFEHDIKRSSAFLNVVAGVRMLDRQMWTDDAVKSMFRRLRPKKDLK